MDRGSGTLPQSEAVVAGVPSRAADPAAPSRRGGLLRRGGRLRRRSGERAGAPAGRLVVLDGLRLLAALTVVAYHYTAYQGSATTTWGRPTSEVFPQIHLFSAYGRFGVELFFLISGFVICMSAWGRSLSDFFTSRVIRLFPAYWFAVIATTAVLALVPGAHSPHAWREVLVNLTMLQRPIGVDDVDGAYWTLWAEMRFYLIFALVVWKGVTYRRVVAFCCLWSVSSILMDNTSFGPFKGLLLPGECWFFIAGLAFYLIHRFGPDLLLWCIVGLSFLMGQWYAMDTYHRMVKGLGFPFPAWGVTALLAGFFLVMAGVSLGWFRWIRWRWLSTAGALTYPLYLLHQYIGWEVMRQFRDRVHPLPLAVGTAAAMMVAAWLVNRLVERPASRALRTRLKASFARMRAFDAEGGMALRK